MKKRLLSPFSDNEKGYSLLIVILTLVLLSVLGVSIFAISNNTMNSSTNERTDQAVYYIAETALVETKAKMTNEINKAMAETRTEYANLADDEARNAYNFDQKFMNKVITNVSNVVTLSTDSEDYKPFTPAEPFEPHFGKQPTAKYSVIQAGDAISDVTYTIQTVGEIDGGTRVVSQKITVKPGVPDPPDPSDSGTGGITFTPSFAIQTTGSISIKNTDLIGEVQLATGLSKSDNDNNKSCNDCINDVDFPDLTSLLELAKKNYTKEIPSGKVLTGPLYIESWDHINGGVEINGTVFVKSGDIKINGGAIINGYLIAPNSNIELNGNAKINGAIIAKSFHGQTGTINFSGSTITVPKTPSPPSYDESKPNIVEDSSVEK